MSDVVRVYSGRNSSRRSMRYKKTKRRRRRGCSGILFLLFIALCVAAWVGWATRNSHTMGELVPADQQYQIYITDLLEKRTKIAEAAIWKILPENPVLDQVHDKIAADLGVPDWVLNNLINGPCHISGSDTLTFTDAVLITRMSRIGCLIEMCRVFTDKIENDPAGGVRLRKIADANLFYAVRGRVVLLSPSRESLIEILTLPPEKQLGTAALLEGFQQAQADDIAGSVDFSANILLSPVINRLSFGLRLEPDQIHVRCKSKMSESTQHWLAPFTDQAVPKSLPVPPSGMLALSADFGCPPPVLWQGLDTVLGDQVDLQAAGLALAGLLDEKETGWPAMLGDFFALQGTGVQLSWQGMDVNEMVPMPELALFFETDPAGVTGFLEAIPPAPESVGLTENYPRYDAETGLVRVPMIGGPSIEPSAALVGDYLAVSNSRLVIETLQAAPPAFEMLPQPANLYLEVHPTPIVQSLCDAAVPLVECGLVRNHTVESFQQQAQAWLQAVAPTESLSLLVGCEDDTIQAELMLKVAAGI